MIPPNRTHYVSVIEPSSFRNLQGIASKPLSNALGEAVPLRLVCSDCHLVSGFNLAQRDSRRKDPPFHGKGLKLVSYSRILTTEGGKVVAI